MIFKKSSIKDFELMEFLNLIYGIDNSNNSVKYLFAGIDVVIVDKIIQCQKADIEYISLDGLCGEYNVLIDKKLHFKYEIKFVDDIQIIKRMIKSDLFSDLEKNKLRKLNNSIKIYMKIHIKKSKDLWNMSINIELLKSEKDKTANNILKETYNYV